MPKLTFKWNSVPKLILGAEVHRLVPKLLVPNIDYRIIDGDNGLLILSERHIVGTIIKFIFSNVPVAMEMAVDPVIQIFVEVNQKTF